MRAWYPGRWWCAGCLVWLLSGCGEGDPTDCACTISVGESSSVLACGEVRCIGGVLRVCDLNAGTVTDGDPCGSPDLAIPPAECIAAGRACDPMGPACCASDDPDAGVAAAIRCDPTARTCCIPTGGPCAMSSDCCPGHACAPTPGGTPRCGF